MHKKTNSDDLLTPPSGGLEQSILYDTLNIIVFATDLSLVVSGPLRQTFSFPYKSFTFNLAQKKEMLMTYFIRRRLAIS